MTVFLFERCYDVYESDFTTVSVHLKKEDAYRRMKSDILRDWYEERDNQLIHGTSLYDPLIYQTWRIRELPVQ